MILNSVILVSTQKLRSFIHRLECSCDEKLYERLSSLCSSIAATIGLTYFDILRPNWNSKAAKRFIHEYYNIIVS